MNNMKILELRSRRGMPIALCAKLVGISIMELWRIETDPEYVIPENIKLRLFKVLERNEKIHIA